MPSETTPKKYRPKKCPTPDKEDLTRGEAIKKALLRSAASGKGMVYYPCVCGHFHISSKTANWSSTR